MMKLTFARFLLVGIANTALGYGTILLLHYTLGASPILANAVGYFFGTLLSYTLNRAYTFASTRPHAQALPRFCLTAATSFVLNVMVLELCLTALKLPFALAQAAAICVYTASFYLISRFLVFRS